MEFPSPHDKTHELQGKEPLLSLITTSYPLLGSTIEGATSAYNQSKNFSPHLRSGAEYIEEYLTPVAKAVGTVGRKTGVEGGVRWILGASRKHRRRHQTGSDLESGSNKRRKAKLSEKEKEAFDGSFPEYVGFNKDRRTSISTIDTLPAYDDHKSPAYTEDVERDAENPLRPGSSSSQWSSRLIVTTSGLGVAMKQESLRNLKYCVSRLRDVNGYVLDKLMSLTQTIEQYDAATARKEGEVDAMTDGSAPRWEADGDRSELMSRMNVLKNDIYKAIHGVMQLVSRYAGSALPENARDLVYRQLMSLPARYQFLVARETSAQPRKTADQDTLTRDAARLALLFAKEGLHMVTQVSDILDRTIASAEQWCEMLGKQAEQGQAEQGKTAPTSSGPQAALTPYTGHNEVQMSGV
jgi:hypothetical protein